MSNEDNKTSLTKFLQDKWKQDKYDAKLQGRKAMFICEQRCMRLTSLNRQTTLLEEVQELCSTHEEADVKIILLCLHVAANSANDATIC